MNEGTSEFSLVWFGFMFLVLWHINLCRSFKAKSISMKIISSISNKSVQHEYTVCQKNV